jgi:hypothetical protein
MRKVWVIATLAILSAATSAQADWVGFGPSCAKSAIDQEDGLRRQLKGALIPRLCPPGNPDTFEALCQSLGKRCEKVMDWHGEEKSCTDKNVDGSGRDGSRIANCVSTGDAAGPKQGN